LVNCFISFSSFRLIFILLYFIVSIADDISLVLGHCMPGQNVPSKYHPTVTLNLVILDRGHFDRRQFLRSTLLVHEFGCIVFFVRDISALFNPGYVGRWIP